MLTRLHDTCEVRRRGNRYMLRASAFPVSRCRNGIHTINRDASRLAGPLPRTLHGQQAQRHHLKALSRNATRPGISITAVTAHSCFINLVQLDLVKRVAFLFARGLDNAQPGCAFPNLTSLAFGANFVRCSLKLSTVSSGLICSCSGLATRKR
jgi:hypothetical protein